MDNWYDWAYKTKIYLHNKVLQFKVFSDEDIDHDHCELCWIRLSKQSGDIHEGYYEPNSKSWICIDCYKNLKEKFGWIVVND